MKKITLFLLVLTISVLADPGDKRNYIVNAFNGGLNVRTDGININKNQALELTNFTLDEFKNLEAREGFSYFNTTVIDADSEIQAIYIYEPYVDTTRMVIATTGFIYILPDLNDPTSPDWDTLRLSFTGDSLDATASSATITATTFKDSWWYTNTWGNNTTGDHLIVDEDDSATEYDIQKIFQTGHNSMTITPVYAGTTGVEMNYTIYKKIQGDPYITQFRNELYICDSDGFSIIYNDTNYTFSALLDSGLISTAVSLNDTITVYSTGKVKVKYQENKVYGNNNVIWQSSWADGTWEITVHVYVGNITHDEGRTTKDIYFDWSSIINDVDSTERVLTLQDIYPSTTPVSFWDDYEIKTIYYLCVLDSGLAVIDSSKNWMDDDLGAKYLGGLRAVFGAATVYGMFYNRLIGCNSDVAFGVPKLVANAGITDDKSYYIFAGGLPYQFTSFVTDDTRMEYPRYRQVAFYNNQLFGLGYRKLVGNYTVTTKDDYNLVWYSYPSIPRYSPSLDYNFSLDENEKNTVYFIMRDNLYIGTDNSIWQYSGIIGESFLRKVVSNNSIPDYDNLAKATEEYSYFANRTGVYRFDGTRPEKISWWVDPIIKDNYNSRIVMGYQDYRLYVSFPDSNFTLVYHEELEAWTKFDFGMTCFYAPPDTNIFYFGHSQDKGRVYYYPNGTYVDSIRADSVREINVSYKSGWQSMGPTTFSRIIERINLVGSQGSDTIYAEVFGDYDNTDTLWIDTITTANLFVSRDEFADTTIADFFQISIRSTVDDSLKISSMHVICRDIYR